MALPFLFPWFLGDKAFEYLFQPAIFRRHNLEVPRVQLWAMRLVQISLVVVPVTYLIPKISQFFRLSSTILDGMKNLRILLALIYNDFAKGVNYLLTPLNHLIYYVSGGPIQFWDLVTSTYI